MFRRVRVQRNYTVRTFLGRFMSCGLISLLIIALIATCSAFFFMIEKQIDQAIGLGRLKNYSILSQTIAELKQTEFEMVGNDVLTSARIMSDLVSSQDRVANKTYLDKVADKSYLSKYEQFTYDGVLLAKSFGKCTTKDNSSYEIYFNGIVKVNGTEIKMGVLPTASMTKEQIKQREHYNENKEHLWTNC